MELNYDLLFYAYIASLPNIPWFNLVSYNCEMFLYQNKVFCQDSLNIFFTKGWVSFSSLSKTNVVNCYLLIAYDMKAVIYQRYLTMAYLTPYQTPTTVFFAKIVNDAYTLPIFVKNVIIYIWEGLRYASALYFMFSLWQCEKYEIIQKDCCPLL